MPKRRNRNADDLRLKLGLNQDQMALWLGVSRSLYAMYERGDRSMPSNALLKYVDIYTEWTQFEAEWDPAEAAPRDGATPLPDKEVQHRIARLENKLKNLQYQLRDLEDLPDPVKPRAFFERRLPKCQLPLEQHICQSQMAHLDNEIERIRAEKKRITREIELISGELAVLKKEAG